MSYFVTGATGFIGRHLVPSLLRRGETVYALVREASLERLEELRVEWGANDDNVVGIIGDLGQPRLGVGDEAISKLEGSVDQFFHLAALYDMAADAAATEKANLDGTRNALALADAVSVARFNHVSSIAVAGRYPGIFREDMFSEAEGLDDPYFRTKHESEGLVRSECPCAWRVYRPGIVVGHSKTGEMDKVDGPYYFFKLLQRLRRAFPQWFPLIGIDGTAMNLVPVDFVAGAIDFLAHADGLDGRAFHLVDPAPQTLGEAVNTFARAAHGPEFGLRLDAKAANVIPSGLRQGIANLPPVRRITDQVLADLGIPRRVLSYASQITRFDCADTTRALEGSGLEVPALDSYAYRLWDYWERNLDPDLHRDRSLAGAAAGKHVLITGASSGIGRATALKVGAAGGILHLVARSADKLGEVKAEIEKAGGTAHIHPADLSDQQGCDALVSEVVAEHGGIDVLINNAGRSIRRSLALSEERFHDFERTMQLNYFGALKLIMGFVPGMRQRGRGHIINVSSLGVQTNPPRFSAYVASKAALDAFSRCAASELVDHGIAITTVYMPLVKTEMIAPTKMYEAFPTLTPSEAADLLCEAIIERPKRVSTRLGIFGEIAYAAAPKAVDVVLNTAYKLFPDSAASRGDKPKGSEDEMTSEAIAFAHLIPGVHW